MKLSKGRVIIKCDYKTVREYSTIKDTDGDHKAIQCYIPSEPGKEFWIEYSHDIDDKHQDAELAVDVYFDGKFNGGWLAPDPEPGAKKFAGEIWGSRNGDKLRHFVFIKPEVTERETPSSTDVRFIGNICVWLGFAGKSECTMLESKPTVADSGIPRVNEKDKPPGAHCVTLKNSSEQCTEPVFWSKADDDALLFVFRCRSKEWLQAEGIMQKPRRQRGEPDPEEDPGVSSLPKPEPQEDVVPPRKRMKTGVGRGAKSERVKVEELEPKIQTSKPRKKKRANARG